MPYDPQTQYRGEQYIFQGGRQTAEALTGWLQNFLDQEKQVTAAGKSADFFVKANPGALDEMGVHPDEWTNLGARQKAAAVQGYVQGKSAQRAGAEAQAQVQLRQAQAAKAQSDADATAGFPDFAKYLNEELSAPGSAPTWPPPGNADWNGFLQGNGPVQTPGAPGGGPMTRTGTTGAGAPPSMSQAVLRALARVQSLNPRTAAAIAAKVLPPMLQNTEDGGPVTFSEDPVTGSRYASKGKILIPSGTNPAKMMSGGAVPLVGTDGGVMGYNIPTGKGNFKPVMTKDLTEDQRQNLINQHQKEQDALLGQLTVAGGNTNAVNAINDRIGMHQDAINALKKGPKEVAPTGPAAADVEYLKSNQATPGLREKFDKKFGAGSAAKILGS